MHYIFILPQRISRYGGITVERMHSSFSALSSGYTGSDALLVRPWFDTRWLHALPAFMNLANNAILRAATGNSAYAIDTLNWPLNKTIAARTKQYLTSGTDLTVAINILIAMAFIPASFAVFIVAERASKAKHLQSTSGVGVLEYWVGNYIWDMVNYLAPALVIMAIFLAFGLPTYTGRNFPAVVLLLLFYGWSVTPMMYPLSFLFSIPSTAYVTLICINLFFGVTCTLTTFMVCPHPTLNPRIWLPPPLAPQRACITLCPLNLGFDSPRCPMCHILAQSSLLAFLLPLLFLIPNRMHHSWSCFQRTRT